ncbi:DMT family transporter [Desertibacillus haloalkaliphilus]|uniref:DMT family transporter n=1 Tax=Desertibacillus haloalkaliphilus TaxID=1328930 RepID=UPI001C266B2C|nr:DMT family transporter [Desertibacillus haloalkaliphilus]MBU8907855.1 DMT family transporter [Desertibacillus haloalkaliphilus]
MMAKLQRLPYLLLVFATFFWGTNFVFSRIIVEEVPPFQLSVVRWGIASLVFLPFVWRELRESKELLKRNWKVLLAFAVTGIAGFNTLLYIAIQYTSSINASLVNSLAPLLIVVLSVLFLKETLVRFQYIGILLSFLGVVIVITEGRLENLFTLSFNPGDLIVVAAVISWSIYSVLLKKFAGGFPKRATFIVTMYIGILCLLPFAIFERTQQPVAFTSLSVDILAGILFLGVFPSIISFICWNEGVMQVGPGKASNYLHLIVLFTTVLAVLFGGEVLTIIQVVGGACILSGVILASNPNFLQKWGKQNAETKQNVHT